jgi:hypothetical protein
MFHYCCINTMEKQIFKNIFLRISSRKGAEIAEERSVVWKLRIFLCASASSTFGSKGVRISGD